MLYVFSGVFFVCSMLVWHALVGSYWSDAATAQNLDNILLYVFVGVLVAINVGVVVFFLVAYAEIAELEEEREGVPAEVQGEAG